MLLRLRNKLKITHENCVWLSTDALLTKSFSFKIASFKCGIVNTNTCFKYIPIFLTEIRKTSSYILRLIVFFVGKAIYAICFISNFLNIQVETRPLFKIQHLFTSRTVNKYNFKSQLSNSFEF